MTATQVPCCSESHAAQAGATLPAEGRDVCPAPTAAQPTTGGRRARAAPKRPGVRILPAGCLPLSGPQCCFGFFCLENGGKV